MSKEMVHFVFAYKQKVSYPRKTLPLLLVKSAAALTTLLYDHGPGRPVQKTWPSEVIFIFHISLDKLFLLN